MEIYWDAIVGPLLVLRQPTTILEIGSEQGRTTRLLLGYCRCYGATLHVIEPLPRYDVAAWQAKYGERFVLHQALSLQALPALGAFDLVLIDGDHNWYTVFHELKLLEKRSVEQAALFPLVLLHDIGWPYGRRDLYYDPQTVPAEHRQPCHKKGMLPGRRELLDSGGANRHLWNARCEGGARNGVLTAVEDFMRESAQPLELIQVPGFHGLGILFASQLVGQNEQLGRFLRSLQLPPVLKRYFELLEHGRVGLVLQLQDLQGTLGQLESAWNEQRSQLTGRLQAAAAQIEAQRAEIARLEQRQVDSRPDAAPGTPGAPSGRGHV